MFSSTTATVEDRTVNTVNSSITSPTKIPTTNLSASLSKRHHSITNSTEELETIISPVSNILSSNGELSFGSEDRTSSQFIHKRRSVSAATTSATTYISVNEKNSRAARTNSSSAISMQSKTSTHVTNKKRSYSPSSSPLTSSNKNLNQRKKQKFSHYWILSGRSEQKLVLIDVGCLSKNKKNYTSDIILRLINHQFIVNVIHLFVILKKKILLNQMTVFYYVLRTANIMM